MMRSSIAFSGVRLAFAGFLLLGPLVASGQEAPDATAPAATAPAATAPDATAPAATAPAATAPAGKGPVRQHTLIPSYKGGYLDLGYLYENEFHHNSFSVTNISEVPQTILKVEPLCDCIKLENDITGTILQPGDSAEVKFIMIAMTVHAPSFGRNICVTTLDGEVLKARIGGRIRRCCIVTPDNEVDLGLHKDPTEKWNCTYSIKKNPDVAGPLVFGQIPEDEFLDFSLVAKGTEEYELVVTPKKTLPYQRKFYKRIRIPVVEPAAAEFLQLELTAQIAEAVNFTPDEWKIQQGALAEAGEFTEHFAYGEVPGVQEEKSDPTMDSKTMLRRKRLMQHNAVPLKFVKQNHDWDDLFAHLEFKVPQGVCVKKTRHPQGIELEITVKKEAFSEENRQIEVVPFRDDTCCAPIKLMLVD